MRRRAVLAAIVLLAGAAALELGHAGWVHVKARLAQHLLQRAWAHALAGDAQARPWPWADTWPVARLRAPAHGVDLIVLDGVSGRTLAFGPGHVSASALPGAPGVAIVTAHRDTHFRFLERVRPGDRLILDVPGRPSLTFVVREASVLDSRIAAIAEPDHPVLVLLTCYPFDAITPGGPLRYAVVADATPD
jgi:sortase A